MVRKLLTILLVLTIGGAAFGQTRPHYTQIAGAPLVDVRAYGAKGDGVTDDRAAIQAALDANSAIFIPDGEYRIAPIVVEGANMRFQGEGLTVKDNQTIVFGPNASLKLLPHNLTAYQMIRVYGVDNIRIYGGLLDGNKAENSATSGEHGMGISITSSSNVTVSGTRIKNTWGDGIYVGVTNPGYAGFVQNFNINIQKVSIDSCRRQGVSVISVDGLVMRDIDIKNIGGTAPEAGIDFEPNHPSESLWGIVLDNVRITDVAGSGIDIGPRYKTNRVQIYATNVVINGAGTGVADRGSWVTESDPVEGAGITFVDCKFLNLRSAGYKLRLHNADNYPIKLIRPTFINIGLSEHGVADAAAIVCFRIAGEEAGDTVSGGWTLGNYSIGNIHVFEPYIDAPLAPTVFWATGRNTGLKNISLIDPIYVNVANTYERRNFLPGAIRNGQTQNWVFSNRHGTYPLPTKVPVMGHGSTSLQQDSLQNVMRYVGRNIRQWGYGERSGQPDRLILELDSAFEMRGQVFLKDLDMGRVELTSSGTVMIRRDLMTKNFPGSFGDVPAFGFNRMTIPRMTGTFEFDTSTSAQDPGMLNVLLIRQSTGALTGSFTSNDGRAVAIYNSSLDAYSATASGSVADWILARSVLMGPVTGGLNHEANDPTSGSLYLE